MERCAPYLELISQALDGPLSEAEQQSLDRHLHQCPQCRELDAQLREIHQQMFDLPEVDVPDGFTQGVMDRVCALEEGPKVVPLFRRPQVKAILGLAACSALAIGLWSIQPDTPTDPVPTSIPSTIPPKTASRAALPEPSVTFAMGPASPDTLDQDQLVQEVQDTLGQQPGMVALIPDLPSELADMGRQLTDAQNRTLLVLEEHSKLLDDVLAQSLLSIEVGEGPIVLIVWA